MIVRLIFMAFFFSFRLNAVPVISDAQIRDLQLKLFDDPKKSQCRQISKGTIPEDTNIKEPMEVMTQLMDFLKRSRHQELAKLFHPRLKIDAAKMEYMLRELSRTYGRPLDFSLFRIWALSTGSGDPGAVACLDDQLALGPHYGYNVQFFAWIQVSGPNDLARLLVSVVPSPNGWRLGAWNLQQWTYRGSDPDRLIEEAVKIDPKKQKILAYLSFDLAGKLLDGGGYVYLASRENVLLTRDKIMQSGELLGILRNYVKVQKVVWVGSVFGVDGPGILVRFMVDRKTKTGDLRPICEQELHAIYENIDHSGLGGSRCSFVVEGESIEHEGYLGSLFLKKAEILKVKAG